MNISISGELFAKVFKNGKLQFEHYQKNMIVDTGLIAMANLLVGEFGNYEVSQIGFGDGTDITATTMLAMTGTNQRKIGIDTVETVAVINNIAKIYWDIDFDTDISGQDMGGTNPWPAEDAFTIKELALFTVNNTMFNRILWVGPDLILNSGVGVSGYFQITINRGA